MRNTIVRRANSRPERGGLGSTRARRWRRLLRCKFCASSRRSPGRGRRHWVRPRGTDANSIRLLATNVRRCLLIDGRGESLRTPRQAVAAGIGYIPRERRTEGLGDGHFRRRQHHAGAARGDDAPRLHRIMVSSERSLKNGSVRLRIKTPSATRSAGISAAATNRRSLSHDG